MHASRPVTDRDIFRSQLSGLQIPHRMIRSIEKVRHRQKDMAGTDVDEYLDYILLPMYC